MNNKITFSWNLLRYVYGLVIFLTGVDKVAGTNFVNWTRYVNPQAISLLPVPMSVASFLFMGGIIEAVVGLLILTKFQRVGGYLAGVWFFIIGIDLFYLGYAEVAIRNIMLAAGAFVLSNLTDVIRSSDAKYPQQKHVKHTIS